MKEYFIRLLEYLGLAAAFLVNKEKFFAAVVFAYGFFVVTSDFVLTKYFEKRIKKWMM